MTRNDRRAQNPPAGAGGPAESLRAALAQRVVVADGAMGTMLQASAARSVAGSMLVIGFLV